MNFIEHPTNTRVLRAPPGVRLAECGPLPVTDTVMNGQPAVGSFWKPSPEELAALNEGHPVVLLVAGDRHPPVFIGVEVPTAPPPPEPVWTIWAGFGTHPLQSDIVEVRLRNGTTLKTTPGMVYWHHNDNEGDIVAYRVLPQ